VLVLLDAWLQATVAEMAKDIKAKRTGETSASAAELYAFVNRVGAGVVGARATLCCLCMQWHEQ
jgi:hypothetical protein